MEGDPRLVKVAINGFSWLVSEGDREGLLVAARVGWGGGQVLRMTPHRRVVRVEGRAYPLLVKHFRSRGVLAFLKGVLRGSPALREWRALHEAQRRGLPIPRPVAIGQRGRVLRRESLLVTEALEGTIPLGDYLFRADRPGGSGRWEAIRQVATLLRKAHDLGLYLPDLHVGNILIRPSEGTVVPFLIDLQRVRYLPSLTPEMRWRNLAILHGGCIEASRSERLRFLKAYLDAPPPFPSDLRRLTAQLDRAGRRHRFHLWRARERRCLAENREFVRVRAGGFSGVVRRDRWDGALQDLLRAPQHLLTQPGARLVKDSRTTTVGVIPFPGGALYVKRYNYQGFGYALKDLCRSSRARRVWIAAHSLRMRGIPVPLPVAYLERRRFRALVESYLLTETLQGDRMTDLLDRFVPPGPSFHEKRCLIREVALFLRWMHERGVAHRDLKGPNILVREGGPGRYHLSLVDLDGVQLGLVSRRRRVKNVARLARAFARHPALTRTDHLRFLKAYLGPSEGRKWREFWSDADSIMRRGK